MPKISKYPAVVTPQGEDLLVVVQGGETKKVALSTLEGLYGTPTDESRITALEDKNVRVRYFAQINSGTTGTITPPAHGTIVLDQFGGQLDAVTRTITAGQYPDPDTYAQTAEGVPIAATLDVAGDWGLTDPPSAYPIAIEYFYDIGWQYFDRTYTLPDERETVSQATGPLNSVIFADITPTNLSASKVMVSDANKKAVSGTNTDAEIADSVSKKHSNSLDHAAGSDNQDISGLMQKSSNLSDVANAATAFGNIKQVATDSATGVVELATDAAAIAAIAASVVLTPSNLAAKYGVYAIHEISEFPDDHTQAGLNLLDDADATAQRVTLGLVIGTNVQAQTARLADIAGLAVTDGNFIVGNGANFVAESGATVRTSLGLAIGTDVMAYEAWPIHEVEELCSVD